MPAGWDSHTKLRLFALGLACGQAGQSYETKQNHKKGGAYYESGGQGLY